MTARVLSTLTTSDTQRADKSTSYFVRLDLPSPVGTLRYTDRALYAAIGHPNVDPAAGTITLSIDGGSQAWSQYDIVPVGLDQGTQKVLSLSALNVANVSDANGNRKWTSYANSPGIKGSRVRVWKCYFNPDTYAFIEAVLFFDGKIEQGHYGKDRAQLTLIFDSSGHSQQTPYMTAARLGATSIMPDPYVSFTWGGRVFQSFRQ